MFIHFVRRLNRLKYRISYALSVGLVFSIIGLMAVGFGKIDSSKYMSVDKPSDIIWSDTGFLVGTGDDGIRISLVSTRLESVDLFAATFKGADEIHMASTLGPSFTEGNVYANRGDVIFEVSKDGKTVRNFATPSPGSNIAALVFDIEKYWNYNLLAVTYDGSVWEIDENTQVTHIANLGSDVAPNGLMVAPADFGDFSGDILVSLANENKIVSISHIDNSVSVFKEFPGEKPGMMLFNIRLSTLYVSNNGDGSIVKIDQENTEPYFTQIMLVTENEQDGSKSINFIRSTRLGVEITKLASGIVNPDFAGAVFVHDAAFEESLLVPEEEVPELDPRVVLYPILVLAAIGTIIVIWKFRGF